MLRPIVTLPLLAAFCLPSLGQVQMSLDGTVEGGSFSDKAAFKSDGRAAVGDDFRSSQAALPHLAIGGPWKTILVATNVSTTPAKARLEVYDPDGRSMVIALKRADTGEVKVADTFTITLTEGSSMTLIAEGGPETRTGWIWYEYVPKTSDPIYGGMLAIQEVFRATIPGRPDLEAVVLPDWALDKKIIAPFDNTGGFRTAVALANAYPLGKQSMIITIRDEDGRVLETAYQSLSPGQQMAFQTDEIWPQTRGRRGTITITTDNFRLASLSLIFNPSGAMTSSQFYSIN